MPFPIAKGKEPGAIESDLQSMFRSHLAHPESEAIHTTDGDLNDINWSPDSSYAALTVNSSRKTCLYILDIRKTLKNPISPPVPIAIGAGYINYNVSWLPMP